MLWLLVTMLVAQLRRKLCGTSYRHCEGEQERRICTMVIAGFTCYAFASKLCGTSQGRDAQIKIRLLVAALAALLRCKLCGTSYCKEILMKNGEMIMVRIFPISSAAMHEVHGVALSVVAMVQSVAQMLVLYASVQRLERMCLR